MAEGNGRHSHGTEDNMLRPERKGWRWCFVPGCKNTSVTAPNKMFLQVPKDLKTRRLWARLSRREDASTLSSKNVWFCCEDHLNLEEDTENYRKVSLVGGNLRLKKGAVPSKFACQPDRMKRTERPTSVRRRNAAVSEDVLDATEEIAPEEPDDGANNMEVQDCAAATIMKDASCQVEMSVASTTSACQTETVASAGCQTTHTQHSEDSGDEAEYVSKLDHSDKDYEVEDDEMSDASGEDFEYEFFVRDRIRKLCEKDPKRYVGVPQGYLKVIEILARDHIAHSVDSKLTPYDICLLVLMKIKQDSTFHVIGDDFGISRSYAGKLFAKHVPAIADAMRELVYWPEPDAIRQALPLAFKARFAGTTCIIDCMEIQVEKPSAAVSQSLTYSTYKSCNTVKYLVSMTPNGFINFVSNGYGGRASDVAILEQSGFLSHLEPGMIVMADRGFKSLEPLLATKGCSLVRPSSVSSKSVMDKREVKWTKQVASLRIHVERAIRRLREFEMLRPTACVEYNVWSLLDACVLIACGLINLQPPLVRV